jgi:hypothetical protein
VHGGKRKTASIGFQGPEGHGEKIWVFAHRRSDQIIYSFKDKLEVSSLAATVPTIEGSSRRGFLTHIIAIGTPWPKTAAVQRQKDEAFKTAQRLLVTNGHD